MTEFVGEPPRTIPLGEADIVLLRHGQTTFNETGLLNGDPSIPVVLSEKGREESRRLGPILARLPIASVYVTRFQRTHETLDLAWPGHPEAEVLSALDDVRLGEFEGRPRDDYRAWRQTHGVGERPVGGESRLDALDRYIVGYEHILADERFPALVITHDQVIRYLANALMAGDPLQGVVRSIANARPYGYDAATIEEALVVMRARVETGR